MAWQPEGAVQVTALTRVDHRVPAMRLVRCTRGADGGDLAMGPGVIATTPRGVALSPCGAVERELLRVEQMRRAADGAVAMARLATFGGTRHA